MTLRNCLDDDLVSFPSFRFLFRELKTIKLLFVFVYPIFFSFSTSMFCTTREKLC